MVDNRERYRLDKVSAAFKRDWDQTKHDFGGKPPETNQNAKDTVKQASGNQPIPPRGEPVYEKIEAAYRFGYGARSHYAKTHPTWNPALEGELRRDWTASGGQENDWASESQFIRKAGNTKIRQNFQSSVNPDCKIRVFLFQATSPSPNSRFSREIAV